MQKNILILFFLIVLLTPSYAQLDTIFFINGNQIGCNVLKVTPNEIEYSYDGETLINVEEKKVIKKIVFKNGRVQEIQSVYLQNQLEPSRKHGQFWGIDLGTDYKVFIEKLKQKGAKFLEYQGNSEVKLVSQFLSFKSADIYVHYNKDGKVYLVDVQQNNGFSVKGKRETIGIIDSLNASYKLVKRGNKPWEASAYRWQWIGDNLIITYNKSGEFSRAHLRYSEPVEGVKEDDE